MRRQRLQAHQPGGVPPVLAEPVSEGPLSGLEGAGGGGLSPVWQMRVGHRSLFLRLLARLPVDVLLLLPNLNEGSALHTPDLLEVHCPQSVSLDRFPVDQNQARVTTAAYQAERDLDRLMYQDTGLYRNQQYAKASTVLLQTMYEEIPILWDQEMKYRPAFPPRGTPSPCR